MPDSEGRDWIFWSTQESIKKDIPSLTATVETALAVVVYGWAAMRFELYLPILVSAAVAPLVLLRSDQSVALGVKWFTAWEKYSVRNNRSYGELEPKERPFILGLVALAALAAGLIAYLLARSLSIDL